MLSTVAKSLGSFGKQVSPAGRKAIEKLFKMSGEDKFNLGFRVLPDIAFAGLEAALTPGDLVEKGLAGLGSGVGSLSGGFALGRLGGKNQNLATLLDMVGSVGGDFGGRYVSDMAARGYDRLKGGQGLTAYERMGAEQQQQFKEQVQAQLLAELGMLPSSAQQILVNPNIG